MIDIGLNLTSGQFRNDIPQLLENAQAAGVSHMIVTGTSVEQSRAAQQLALDYPQCLYATAGIHPHDASGFEASSLDELKTLLAHEKVVAVGECGLDFNRNYSPVEQQLECFEAQLALAVELQLPIFLHQRDAHGDFIRLVEKYRSQLVAGVAHCFTGGREELIACLELDLHIGITGWLCDERRGRELQSCVALIPVERLMIETDAPYLFPRDLKLPGEESLSAKQKKRRRSRNEPQYLPHIMSTLAQIRGDHEQQLEAIIAANTRHFFKI